MDLIALHQAGVTNSVASLGTAITQEHVKILRRYGSEVELVMCYDGDSAGIRAAVRNSKEFEAAGCAVRVARLPQGEDPDTYIQQHGVDSFRALLNRAEPLLDYQLNELRARYNLSDETARLPFVREAARIIAESGSHLVRQEYAARLMQTLDRLADEWYPGDPHRAMQARIALRDEVNRLLRTGRQDGQATRRAPNMPVPKTRLSGRAHAERYLVRAALAEFHWAVWIAERLKPEHFAEAELQRVVEALFGDGERSDTAGERAEAIRNDPAFAELASGLLLDETPLSEERLEESLLILVRVRKEERLRELQEGLKAGTLQPEEMQELLQLQAELGGRRHHEG
jgi:DNA primase